MPDFIERGDGKPHVIYPRTSAAQMRNGITVLTSGDGMRVTDDTGKEYLDFVSGWTRPVHVGYRRAEIAQAVHDQIMQLHYYTPMQYGNPRAIELAQVLAELTPTGITQFLFVSSGSEALESALKLARHYHYYRGERWRFKVISRRGAFHGVTGGALRVLGSVLPVRHLSEPLAPGGVFAESPYCYRCPLHLSYPACDLACARDVERLIQFEDPAQIGVFVGETIQQGFGAVAPPPEYWPIIRQLCDRYGILLVVDEVICGFGRTGKWFGVEHFDLAPDMLLMAKGISSGYMPMGALGATEAVMAPVDNFANLQTYMNHPVACAAALANIEILKRERLIDNARVMGDYFLDGLKLLTCYEAVGEVRGIGLWAVLDLTTDRSTRALFPADRLERMVQRAKEKGLIIKFMHCALEFAPSLVVTRGDIDLALRIIDECLAEDARAH